MPKRKFIIVCGAENATDVASPIQFEELMPFLALRNPGLSPVVQHAEGGYADLFELPGVFAGGPQIDALGAVLSGSYQTANLRGAAVRGIRFLTLYNPAAVAQGVEDAVDTIGFHAKFPGTATVTEVLASNRVMTDTFCQTPEGGEIASVAATVITLVNTPPLVVGDPVTFQGSSLPAELSLGTTYYIESTPLPNDFTVAATPGGSAISITGPFTATTYLVLSSLGTITRQRTGTTHTATPGDVDLTDEFRTRELYVEPAFTPDMIVGEELSYDLVCNREQGATASKIALTAAYGGRDSIAEIGVAQQFVTARLLSRDPDGDKVLVAFINKTYATGDSVVFSLLAGTLPVEIVDGVTYYVVGKPSELTTTGLSVSASSFALDPGHGFCDYERVRVLNPETLPVPQDGPVVDGTTDYYIRLTGGDQCDLLRSASPTTSVVFTGLVVGSPLELVTSARDATGYLIGVNPGGAPITLAAVVDQLVSVNVANTASNPDGTWRGSLSGAQLRCITGPSANVGEARPLSHVEHEVAAGQTFAAQWQIVDPAFPAAPAKGDRFVVEPPPVSDTPVPFRRWAKWLPWSPFEGRQSGGEIEDGALDGTGDFLTLTVADAAAKGFEAKRQVLVSDSDDSDDYRDSLPVACGLVDTINGDIPTTGADHNYQFGDVVGLDVGTGVLPLGFGTNVTYSVIEVVSPTVFRITGGNPLTGAVFVPANAGTVGWSSYSAAPEELGIGGGGDTYYVESIDGDVMTLADTYGGEPVLGAGEDVTKQVRITDHVGKINPYPPGFNYPTSQVIPGPYQAFDSESYSESRIAVGLSTPLGYRMFNHIGTDVYVINLAFPLSTLGHREIGSVTSVPAFGWSDPRQQVSWMPGEPNNCFGVLLDWLDAAKVAFAEQGDTGECVGVFWLQGEEDATYPMLVDRYAENLARFRQDVRDSLAERDMVAGKASLVPFVAVDIVEDGTEGRDSINASIQAVVDADPMSRAVSIADIIDFALGIGLQGDSALDSATLVELAERVFDSWMSMQSSGTSEVDIVNLALANIGETARVTSIDPPDGSAQADVAARFYPIARDMMLERHTWDFSTLMVKLTPIELPAATTSQTPVNAAEAAAFASSGGSQSKSNSGRFDWEFAYEWPANITGILAIATEDSPVEQQSPAVRDVTTYTVELNANSERIIYSNIENAAARCSIRVDDPTRFSALFVRALSFELAAAMAGTIVKGEAGAAMGVQMAKMAKFYESSAQSQDSSKRRKPDGALDYPWRRDQGYSSFGYYGPARGRR